jgi:CRP/FNR family transcriptional regulator, cyclic AMP receptor protein
VASPYGMDITESCLACRSHTGQVFCSFSATTLKAFEAIKFATIYPAGSVLFLEGQAARGVFVLCKGRVKLSICSSEGKSLILKIAEPGEVLGLSATVSGRAYGLTAETLDPCQVNFVKRDDFLRLVREHGDACLHTVEALSDKYNAACQEIRSLGLSHSAAERLGRFLLECSSRSGQAGAQQPRLKIGLTHEEIAELIGTSRETVTRVFTEMRKRQIVEINGATVLIRNKAALERLVAA